MYYTQDYIVLSMYRIYVVDKVSSVIHAIRTVEIQCMLCSQGTLHLGRLTGDGTGLMEIHSHNVTIGNSQFRTHINAHVRLYQGATLTMPDVTYFERMTDIQGMARGVHALFVRGHTKLQDTGSMTCETGATAGHYWLTESAVLNGGRLEAVASSASDLSAGIHLQIERFDVEYDGKVSINGAFTVFAAIVNIEKSAVVDGIGYTASTGPGHGCDSGYKVNNGQSGSSGAGYGGRGGNSGGGSCSTTPPQCGTCSTTSPYCGSCSTTPPRCNGGLTYGIEALPKEKGSGGGNYHKDVVTVRYGGNGGAAVRFAISKLMVLEGWLKMDGADGQPRTGGGSGGAVWLDASCLEGWGKMNADGGAVTSTCVSYCSQCCYHCYGGGGGGGRIRAVSPSYGNKVVLNHHSIAGGTDAAGHGSPGTWTVDPANKCSDHGQWNITSCECHSGYVGDDCQYSCDADVTCGGHGTCGDHGQCVCHVGRVGYHCEYVCDPVTTCSGHGQCSPCGICVCDACFHGDGCSQECHGGGNCIADRCVCDSCHLGAYCESTCNGHGVCVDAGNNSSRCRCDVMWRGGVCTRPGCPGDTEDCSGNGVCNAADNVCYCNPGWSGKIICEICESQFTTNNVSTTIIV